MVQYVLLTPIHLSFYPTHTLLSYAIYTKFFVPFCYLTQMYMIFGALGETANTKDFFWEFTT